MAEQKRTHRRTTAFLILSAGFLILFAAASIPLLVVTQQNGLASAAPIISPVTTNYLAPQLTLTNLQGNSASLDDYRGQVILVNNWATWCPPCKLEMPDLQAYFLKHSEEGFVIIAIESGESADQVADFIKELGITFPVWLDPQTTALDVFQNWSLPSSYVIDRDGIVRLSWTGGINQPTLEKYVTPLLEEKK
jgi:peroxiredoxin